ncbi:MAG: M23 family metallopeptidase [Myxococcota bacterium]
MLALLLLAHARAACPPIIAASGQDPVDGVQAAILADINRDDAAALFERFGGPMKAAVPAEAAAQLVGTMREAGGCVTRSTRLSGSGQRAVYTVQAEKRAWQLDLHVDEAGVVQGLQVGHSTPGAPAVTRSAPLSVFPVAGKWDVIWGGDTQELNAHVSHQSQRRATDLVVTDAAGATHSGDGTRLSDYYAYGRPVRAVAGGVVVTAIDGVPESIPGTLNPYFALGNAVIVDHGGYWSVYAHLQPGSVRVRPGSRVRAGARLGLVGNTGNSSEPHLHFQLQDGPRVETSWGIDAVFQGLTVTRDGKALPPEDYTVRKGDVIEAK